MKQYYVHWYPKTPKQVFYSVLWILFIIAFFIIVVNIMDKKWQNYHDKTVELRHTNKVTLKVTKILPERGYLYFNDSIYVRDDKLILPNSSFNDVYHYKLEFPFYLQKEANNDTIWIIDNKNETYFLVLRKDRDFVKFNIELPDTIYKGQQNIPIILRLENIRPETLSINNPAHWWNTYPQIKRGKKKVSILKANNLPANDEILDTIHIQGNETLRIKYDFTLDELFDLEDYPSGEYNIAFKFFYERKYNKEFEDITLLKVLFSNRAIQEKAIQYEEEEFIMSDKFTFYLQ